MVKLKKNVMNGRAEGKFVWRILKATRLDILRWRIKLLQKNYNNKILFYISKNSTKI